MRKSRYFITKVKITIFSTRRLYHFFAQAEPPNHLKHHHVSDLAEEAMPITQQIENLRSKISLKGIKLFTKFMSLQLCKTFHLKTRRTIQQCSQRRAERKSRRGEFCPPRFAK